jgi:hypothetical protein
LEQKEEDVGNEFLEMSMVLKKIAFPGPEPKLLECEVSNEGQRVPQRQGGMCQAGDFPTTSGALKKIFMVSTVVSCCFCSAFICHLLLTVSLFFEGKSFTLYLQFMWTKRVEFILWLQGSVTT